LKAKSTLIFQRKTPVFKIYQNTEEQTMKYVCDVCGWVYDEEAGYPEGGIAPGTKWEDVPEDFECPLCSVGKDMFSEE
jgi:rubredoxin-NAD+ reductase